jgi:hypothetical protein
VTPGLNANRSSCMVTRSNRHVRSGWSAKLIGQALPGKIFRIRKSFPTAFSPARSRIVDLQEISLRHASSKEKGPKREAIPWWQRERRLYPRHSLRAGTAEWLSTGVASCFSFVGTSLPRTFRPGSAIAAGPREGNLRQPSPRSRIQGTPRCVRAPHLLPRDALPATHLAPDCRTLRTCAGSPVEPIIGWSDGSATFRNATSDYR